MDIPSQPAGTPSTGRDDLDVQQPANLALAVEATDAIVSEHQGLPARQGDASGSSSSQNLPPRFGAPGRGRRVGKRLTRRRRIISDRRYSCRYCSKEFHQVEYLRQHELRHDPHTHSQKVVYDEDPLARHLPRHEENDDPNSSGVVDMGRASAQSMPERRDIPSPRTQEGYLIPRARSENGEGYQIPDFEALDDAWTLKPNRITSPRMEVFTSAISLQFDSSTPNNLEHYDSEDSEPITRQANLTPRAPEQPVPIPVLPVKNALSKYGGPRLYCHQCQDQPEGFRGSHELKEHILYKHGPDAMVERGMLAQHAEVARERILRQTKLTTLAPKPAVPVTYNKYPQLKHPRVYCDQCQDFPEGFYGKYEFRRHVNAKHEGKVKKFVCRDPATVGLVSNIEPTVPLSECKACVAGKQYGASYNAKVHLRRAHFRPKTSRVKNQNSVESNDERRGLDWPTLADLRLWIAEMTVQVGHHNPDFEEDTYALDDMADKFTITQPLFSPTGQITKDSAEAKPGVPLTDSGYGSILNPSYATNDAYPEATCQDATDDTRADDAMTIYSAATTVTPHHAQQYISEFCDDLHSKLKQHIDSKTWRIVFQRLPELIKAFALRLGQESASATGRNIMNFLHKHHQEIAKQMESVVLGAGGGVGEDPKADTKGMSLFDRMNMWNERADQSDEISNRDDCFEGVYDVDEEDSGQVDRSVYNKTILNSAAYQWFIAAIQKEQRIDRGGIEDRSALNEVRKTIIDRLPTTRISKRRPAPSSDVAFRLHWWQMKPRLEAERARLGLPLGKCLSNAITVTGSYNGAQASAVMNYMSQTWPMSTAILLSALEYVVDNEQGAVYHAQLLDKTMIRVHIQGGYLLVALRGPAQSIAECGEQLAWLAAGLSPSQIFNHCTTVIKENDYDCSWIDFASGCKVTTFDVDLQQSNVESNLSKAPCLVRAVGSPSIITGFPTARRPENFPGLEIDTDLLLSVIKITDDGFIWPGCEKRLEIFKQTDGVVLWHICHSSSRHCSCCMRHCSIYPRGFLPMDSLRACRHIVDSCGDPDHLVQLWPPTTKDISTLMAENQPEQDYNPTCLKDTPLSCGSPQRMGADSTDASFESDLFSDSDSSEAYEPLDTGDQHFPALNQVLQTLLSGFRESRQVRKRPGQSETSSGTGSETFRPLRAAISTDLPSNPCRKRQRQQSDDEGSGNEDMPPPNKRAALPQGKRGRQQLACPFWKRNPGQHKACFSKVLRRIRDVKQHLTRKHTPEFYCECCCATFDNEDSHRRHVTHVSGETCVHDPTVVLDGISHQQHRRLSKKSDFKLSDEEQWFSVWDIVFPGSQRPVSAYLDLDLSEEISSFREYCFQYGPATLEEALADEIPEIERREHLVRICQTGYNRLFEEWYSSRDSRETSSRNGSTSTSQSGARPPQCQPTPSSSLDNSFLKRENPAVVDLQPHYPILNLDMDTTRPLCAWNDASQQLPLGTMASGGLQIPDQDLVNMSPSVPLQPCSGAGERSIGQYSFDPTVCDSAVLQPGDMQVDGGIDFTSFLNYAGDTNPNQ